MTDPAKKKLTREFLDYYLTSSMPSIRAGLLITFVLFIGFAVANKLIFPQSTEQSFFLRFGIIVPSLLISLLATYLSSWRPYLPAIFIWVNVFLAIGIFVIGFTSDFSTPGYEYFYSWVMLVVVGTYTFYRIRFRNILIIGLLQMTAYVMATLLNRSYEINAYSFVNNLFFIIAISSLGFFIAFILQRINMKDYLHQKALSVQYEKLKEENKERRRIEQELSQSEQMYHTVLDSIPDWIYLLNREMQVIYINPSLKSKLKQGGFGSDVVNRPLSETYPFLSASQAADIESVFHNIRPVFREEKYTFGERSYYTDTAMVPILSGGEVIQALIIARDRSHEKEVEELKLRNAEQKEIMLREIHHRVKNNLAIVISLLGLQYNNNPIPELRKIILDIELRIRSMALIHEHLYRSENLDRIPLDEYLTTLSQIVRSTFSNNHVELKLHLDPMEASIETALPLGLITNELLTNSFKYAFPDKSEGMITLILKKQMDGYNSLTIHDNGAGLPEGFTLERQNSLGMFIIKLLSEQLDGQVRFSREMGTSFTILFPDLLLTKV